MFGTQRTLDLCIFESDSLFFPLTFAPSLHTTFQLRSKSRFYLQLYLSSEFPIFRFALSGVFLIFLFH